MEEYAPGDPEHFGIRVMAFIGSPESDAVDSFDVVVCAPSWLSDHFDDKKISGWAWEPPGVRFGDQFLFME